MKKIELAIFLSLNGQAEAAISFYQTIFDGDLLFKITNEEFKEKLNPSLVIPKGQEKFISHSIIQIGGIQLQIADNPIYNQMTFTQGNTISFSVLTEDIETAQKMYNQVSENKLTQIIQVPIENEFAEFYSIVQDPFGVIIQISKEKNPEPKDKGLTS